VRVLNRHISKKLVIAFATGQLVYGVAFLIQSIFMLLGIIVEKHASVTLGFQYFLTLLPRIITYTFPVAVMFSGFFVTAVLAENSELVILNSVGLSPREQMKPYIWMGIVSTLVFLFLQFQILPLSRQARSEVVKQISSHSVLSAIEEGRFNGIGKNAFVRFRSKNLQGELQDILLVRRSKTNYTIMTAMKGRLFSTSPDAIELNLENGHDYTVKSDDLSVMATQYRRKYIHIPQEIQEDDNIIHIISNQEVSELLSFVKGGDPIAKGILVRRICVAWLVLLSPLFGFLISFSLQRGRSFGGALFFSLLISYCYIFFAKLLEEVSLKGGHNPVFLVPIVAIVFTVFTWQRYRRILRLEKERILKIGPGDKKYVERIKRIWGRIEVISGKSRTRILSAYLYRGFLKTLVASFFAIEGIFVLGSMIEMTSTLLKVKGSAGIVAWYVLFSAVEELPTTLPLACLIAGLFHLSMLGRRSELTAMKAMGVSVFAIVRPTLRVVLVLSVLMLITTTFLAPYSGFQASRMKQEIKERKNGRHSENTIISYPSPIMSVKRQGVFYDVEAFHKGDASLSGFKAFELAGAGSELSWFYAADKVFLDPKAKTVNSRIFNMNSLTVQNNPPLFDPPSFFEDLQTPPDELTSSQLLARIRERKALDEHPYQLITSYYARFAVAFSSFILLLVGLPLLFKGKGRDMHPAMGFTLAILLLVIFYAVSALFGSMGAIHVLPPLLAAWSSSLIFVILGLFFFTRVNT